MNEPTSTDVADLTARRQLSKTLAFVAETLAGRRVHCIGATGSPLGEIWQLRAPLVDIVATRLPAPTGRRDMLDWSRSQQRPLVLARVRAPQQGLAELLLDVAFSEGTGAALLTDMQLAVIDSRNKFLLGPQPGDVNLRVMPDALVPTLTSPGNPRAVARAIFDVESRFADFLWS
jgi:hypothetical protein